MSGFSYLNVSTGASACVEYQGSEGECCCSILLIEFSVDCGWKNCSLSLLDSGHSSLTDHFRHFWADFAVLVVNFQMEEPTVFGHFQTVLGLFRCFGSKIGAARLFYELTNDQNLDSVNVGD